MRKFSIALTAIIFSFLGQSSGFSHSSVIETIPQYQSTISTLPRVVSIRFSEEPLNIAGKAINSITVTSPSGTLISKPLTKIDKNTLITSIGHSSEEVGTYGVHYRMVSADGHVIAGNYVFYLGHPSTVAKQKNKTAESENLWWGEHFFHQHRNHIFYAVGVVAIAIPVLIWRRRAQSR